MPLTGVKKPQNREKRVSESHFPHFPPLQKRASRVKKSPFLYRAPQGKWGFLTRDALFCRKVADVWEKDVWDFQAKSGSSGSCCLFLHFLGKITVRQMSGRTPGSPRHPSSRHPRPSDESGVGGNGGFLTPKPSFPDFGVF